MSKPNLTLLAVFIAGIALGSVMGRRYVEATRLETPAQKANVSPKTGDPKWKTETSNASRPTQASSQLMPRGGPTELRAPAEASYIANASKRGEQILETEYADLFASLGLDSEQAAQFKQQLQKMINSKIEENYFAELLIAQRADYDRGIREALGPKYEEYRKWEENVTARRESAAIGEFGQALGLEIGSEDANQLLELISKNGAYTRRTLLSGGFANPYLLEEAAKPYSFNGNPEGAAAAGRFYQGEVDDMITKAYALYQDLTKTNMRPEVTQVIAKYYLDQAAARQRVIGRTTEFLNDPIGARLNEVTNQLAQLSSDPKTDPALVQRVKNYQGFLERAKASQSPATAP
jgi:hypothetical protein